jgi:hypothetical protein
MSVPEKIFVSIAMEITMLSMNLMFPLDDETKEGIIKRVKDEFHLDDTTARSCYQEVLQEMNRRR